MAFSQSQWFVFVALIASSWLGHTGAARRDICSKFAIGGPCLLLQPPIVVTSPPRNTQTDSPYCNLVCSQGKAELFGSVCPCANATTTDSTTTILTTTPKPVTCYYSSQRPVRLSGRARRLYSSTPVVTECEYPGVIGLFFYDYNDPTLYPACVGSLLEEDTILVSEECYNTYFNKTEAIYVMTNSYHLANFTKDITVDMDSAKKLDLTESVGYFYTAKLSTKLTFDGGCIEPVCVPNSNIPVTDIDLTDCRIVGYGTLANEFNLTDHLNEIKVTVDPDSVGNINLTVQRIDGETGMMCLFGDESAPLICSHKTTQEWITVGATVAIGYPCDEGTLTHPTVTSLLKESTNKVLHDSIQRFKYADPKNFPVDNSI